MLTDINIGTETVEQQLVRAKQQISGLLGLGDLKPKQMKLLESALFEVAAAEIERNGDFKERLRRSWQARVTVPLSAPTQRKRENKERDGSTANDMPPRPRRKKKEPDITLVPVGTVDPSRFATFGPTDPYALLDLYGVAQLRQALGNYTLAELKQSVAFVQQRHPGTKPTSLAKLGAVIDYIVRYVTGQQ